MRSGPTLSLPRRSTRTRALAVCLTLATSLVGAQAAIAPSALAATSVTYEGPVFPPAASSPTEDKPQSKLWYADGSWWALMRASVGGITVHELEADHTWRNTGTVVDDRPESSGDALWEDGKLYVASRTATGAIEVIRLSYNTSTDTYAVDAGFPKTIDTGGSESVTIAKDSQDRLWVTYTQDSQVWVARSDVDGGTWGAPFAVPVPNNNNNLDVDDISAIIAFSGKIGVAWSDHVDDVIRFAVHPDTAEATEGWVVEEALSGEGLADDHLNLKSLLEDDNGRIFAAVKTSLDDTPGDPSAPNIMVLSRTATGTWSAAVAATAASNLSRPQLALDKDNKALYVFMTTESAGNVFYKRTRLDKLSFGGGTGVAVIDPGNNVRLNNVTTAKAPVTESSKLVLMASQEKNIDPAGSNRYYHAEMTLDSVSTPVDTMKPSVPRAVTATSPAAGSALVSWSQSFDNTAVASYRVSRTAAGSTTPQVVAAAHTSTSFTDTTVASGTQYSYTVSAVDGAATPNRSAESAAATVTPSGGGGGNPGGGGGNPGGGGGGGGTTPAPSDGAFTGGPGAGADGTFRASGADRYETAAALSRESFNPGVPVVYLATGRGYADALAAGPAAAKGKGPLLLTETGELPAATLAELTRLAPQRIVVVGGTSAVSEAAAAAAGRIAPTTRIAGADRYETAALIADSAFAGTTPSAVYVATGTGFADALAGSAAAGAAGVPMLLTDPRQLPAATSAALDRLRPGQIVVVGGDSAVSPAVATQLGAKAPVTRVAGADRYATATAISAGVFAAGTGTAYLATGENFPDALAGAAVAATEGAPLLLVQPGCAPAGTVAEAQRLGAKRVVALGGTSVLSEQAARLASC